MALFSAVSGLIGGKSAADAIEEGNRRAQRTQREMYQTNLRLLQPQYQIGQSAMFQLADLYGLDRPAEYTSMSDIFNRKARRSFGPHPSRFSSSGEMTSVPADERQEAAMGRFFTSPGYSFRLNEGLKALDRSAAARGQMLSGAHLKDYGRFSQGLASSEYANYFNRLAAMAGYGQSATTQATGLGARFSDRVAGLYADTGAARASGILTGVQGIQSGVQNTMDFISANPGSVGLPGG